MEIIIFLGGIVILALVFNLRSRIQTLERFIKSGVTERAPEPSFQTKSTITSESVVVPYQIIPASVGPTPFDKFINWLKDDWLLKVGAILLLIGFGWLTTYAFLNNWIGPNGRIALGIIAGALFLMLGWWRIKKYIHQGGVFLVLGSTTILLTIFAAREIYGFFSPFSALAVMFLSTAFVAFVSVKYNSRALALASLILAGIAPLLTNSPTADYVGLFSYLFVVTLGVVWVVALTGRRELTTAALILITFYSLPHFTPFTSADTGVLLLFAYAFSALFFITNTAGILKLKDKEIVPDLITAAGNGLFLLSWIMFVAQDEWKSLIISAWMIVFTVGAFMIFRITQRREPLYVYACVGIAMLAAATSAELRGATLTIAYTIESGLISFIAYLILKDIRIVARTSLLLIGPILLSFGSIIASTWDTGVLHKDFFVLFVLGLTLLVLGLFFFNRARETVKEETKQLSAIFLVAGSLYACVLLWLSLHAYFQNDNNAVMISLAIYTIIGLILYFYGLTKYEKGLRIYGGVIVGFVVGRLLVFDIWEMDMAGKIVIFFLIGSLLVSTAFLGKKKQKVDLPNNTQ